MSDTALLKKVATDISILKTDIAEIRQTIDDIDSDLHRNISPEYLRKLERIQNQKQKGHKFKTISDFDSYIRQKAKE